MQDARMFAIAAHGAQKYGESPYVVHLDEVAALVQSVFGDDPRARAVAFLHDVREDTDVTREEIEAKFGPEVASDIEALTDPPGKNRRERKAVLHRRLSQIDAGKDRIVLVVKVADRLANVRRCHADNPALLEMYRKEHKDFRPATWRPGLCDTLWEELDRLLELPVRPRT